MCAGEAPEQKNPGGSHSNVRICSPGPITAVLIYFFFPHYVRQRKILFRTRLPPRAAPRSLPPGDTGASSHGTRGTCRPRNRLLNGDSEKNCSFLQILLQRFKSRVKGKGQPCLMGILLQKQTWAPTDAAAVLK